jgi:hypothetical protein
MQSEEGQEFEEDSVGMGGALALKNQLHGDMLIQDQVRQYTEASEAEDSGKVEQEQHELQSSPSRSHSNSRSQAHP